MDRATRIMSGVGERRERVPSTVVPRIEEVPLWKKVLAVLGGLPIPGFFSVSVGKFKPSGFPNEATFFLYVCERCYWEDRKVRLHIDCSHTIGRNTGGGDCTYPH